MKLFKGGGGGGCETCFRDSRCPANEYPLPNLWRGPPIFRPNKLNNLNMLKTNIFGTLLVASELVVS